MTTSPQLRESPATTNFHGAPGPAGVGVGAGEAAAHRPRRKAVARTAGKPVLIFMSQRYQKRIGYVRSDISSPRASSHRAVPRRVLDDARPLESDEAFRDHLVEDREQ